MDFMVISVEKLSKQYSVYKKEPGLLGSVKSLVNRKYENVKAVEDISFNIEEGEFVGFIGPNGAGKTTTLKMLSGLLYPSHGDVKVLGFTPFDRKVKFLKQISLVLGQKNQLWWDLPAIESMILNKEIYGITQKDFDETLDELTTLLDAKELLNVQVRKLSLGQRMKMELIAALIHKPKILFLDEPTIGLDVIMQQKIREFLKEYNEKTKATIILTSHYMDDVQELCKRVIVINFGQLIFDGELDKLIKKYSPFKKITVILGEELDRSDLEKFGHLYSYSYPEWVLHVPPEKTNKVAAAILEKYAVEDISIENPEIESVIQDVFSGGKNAKVL